MTKRVISMLLAICMVFSLLPIVALTATAAEGDLPATMSVAPSQENNIPATISLYQTSTSTGGWGGWGGGTPAASTKYDLYLPGNANASECFFSWDGGLTTVDGTDTYASGALPIPAPGQTKTYKFTSGSTTKTFEVTTYQGSAAVKPIFIEIDESLGTIDAMNNDREHNTECSGTIFIDGVQYGLPKMKGRGNATWTQAKQKRAYNLTLDKKTTILGIDSAKTKKWSILANIADHTLLRCKVGFDMAHEMGIGQDSASADIWMNGKYMGTYLVTPKTDSFVTKNGYALENDNYKEKPIADGGDPSFDLEGLHGVQGSWIADYEYNRITVKKIGDNLLEGGEETVETLTAATEKIQAYMQEAWDAIRAPDGYNSQGKYYTDYVDLPSWAAMYLMHEYVKSFDVNAGSILFHRDGTADTDKLIAGPLWDLDNALGRTSNNGLLGSKVDQMSGYGWYIRDISDTKTSIFKTLGQHADFMEEVTRVYEQYKSVFDGAADNLDKLASEMVASAEMNFKKVTQETYNNANVSRVTTKNAGTPYEQVYKVTNTWQDYVDNLDTYLKSRSLFFANNLAPCEHTYEAKVVAPTCAAKGYTLHTCTKCGTTYTSDETDMVEHTWNEGVVTVKPTTSAEGEMTYTCKVCGTTKTETLPKKPTAAMGTKVIDFTDPSQYEIVNPESAEVRDGGLYLVSTMDALENANSQLSGAAATTPKDLVKIPVSGDWTATMKFAFNEGGSRGWYEFFGFYAMDEAGNLVGIRGGDGSIQDFLRQNGNMVKETMSTSTGLKSASAHWFRIEKAGDSYTCYWSVDGEAFTKIFAFEETGIEGEYLVIDAYSGMATGYNYTVESVELETPVTCPEDIDFTDMASADRFEIINQATAAQTAGTGLTLVSTKDAMEPCNSQLSGTAATTPKDLVEVPVFGNWTATLEFQFSQGSSRGWYEFFGFYAKEGSYDNLVGMRGGDGAIQDFLRQDGSLTADTAGVKTDTGLKASDHHWFRLEKVGDTYTCYWSIDGENFDKIFAYEGTGIEADALVIDAYTGMAEGYTYTLKSLDFEALGAPAVEKPRVGSVSVNGVALEGFDPDTFIYNIEVAKSDKTNRVITAEPANASTTVTVEQIPDGVFGTAVITATNGKSTVKYSISFNYGPEDDYFADGDMSDNWSILNEVKDPTAERPWTYYRFEEGVGLVLPTQKGSIYMAKQADPQGPWTNVFLMPAQGDWEVVTKSFYPQLPKDIYQQTQVFAWQDEDHYIRINCQYNAQQNLRVEPAAEIGANRFDILDVTYANPNADNTATLYYKINKTGSKYTVSYSTDCKTWIAGGSVDNLNYIDPKFGLFCTQDDGNDNYIELSFEYVAVTSRNGEVLKTDAEVLTWGAQKAADYMAAGLPETTAENLTVKAPHGYTVEFVSGNTDVIAADGTVTAANEDTAVEVAIKVTEGDVVATSETVTINVPGTHEILEEPEELAILTQPVSYVGNVNDKVTFSVVANRSDVTYQWMYCPANGSTWAKSTADGCNSAELSILMKTFRVGQKYKVIVTDSRGNSVESDVITMSTPAALKITANPVDFAGKVNATATFSVQAEGEGLTYQWYYSNNNGAYWSKSTMTGSDTASLNVTVKAFRNGQQYKCVVTDASGNVVESKAAAITVQ